MAAILEKLAAQVSEAASLFRQNEQPLFAEGLEADASRYASQAKIARKLGVPETFGVTPVLPEGAIRLPDVTTLGMSNTNLEKLANFTNGFNVGGWARDIIQRARVSSEEPQRLSLAALDARTMGLSAEYPTTKQIWEKAKKFGDRVSAEAMVNLAVEAARGNVQVEIGKPLVGIMEPITDSRGHPRVLCVERSMGDLWLDADIADPDNQWIPGGQFVVSLRK